MVQSQQKVGDQTITEKPPVASFWNVYLLGIAMKLGGCTIAWNYGLKSGFWEYFIAIFVIGFAYLMLGLCMAEMVSIMSFSGGYYGYARCAIGPLGGFLVGCSGAMESIFYLAMYVLKIGQFCTIVFDMDEHDQPISWVVIYIILIAFHVVIGRYFWNVTSLIGLGTLFLVFVYLFGTIGELDFHKYALHGGNGFDGNKEDFLSVFRLAVLFFLGFDMITLTSSELKDSKSNIPKVMLALIGTLFVLSLWLMVTVSSQSPGISSELYGLSTLFPLVFGYEKIFSIGIKQATAIAVIPTFATAMGYLHIVGRQIKSMSISGLLPPMLKIAYGPEETPIAAMTFVACVALGGNYFAWREGVYTTTSRVATMAGCFVYLAMFYCFYVFRRRYGHLERGFHNPLGYYGAILGAVIFATVLIILIFINMDLYYPMTLWYFSYIAFMLIYYYAYAESHQCFSASEQKVFFKAYILNMQIRKKRAMHKRFASDVVSLVIGSIFPSSSRRMTYLSSDRSGDRSKTPHKPDSNRDSSNKSNSLNQKTTSNRDALESIVEVHEAAHEEAKVTADIEKPHHEHHHHYHPTENDEQEVIITTQIIEETLKYPTLDPRMEQNPF